MNEHKSERIKQVALANGWKSQVVPELSTFEKTQNPSDIAWVLYAIRGNENIKVVWTGNLFTSATYKHGMSVLHPARTGSVVKLLEATPKAADSGIKTLDWTDETPAFDILMAVIGKEIVWTTASGEVRAERCPKDTNLGKSFFRVTTTKAGKRVLEWCNSFGFQACYVENVLEIN